MEPRTGSDELRADKEKPELDLAFSSAKVAGASLVDFFVLTAIDLNAPTALGVPLGTLLIILLLWKLVQQGGSSTSENTMDVKLLNELGDEVIQFLHSEANFRNGRCVIKYTIKLKYSGTFVIAGGQADSGYFDAYYCGTRTVSGNAGDVISGALECPQFGDGVWGIGAFRSASDVPRA